MDLNLTEEALENLEDLSDEAREEVIQALEEFEEEQFHHPDIKQIKDRDGKWIWRMKIKRKNTDHRAFIDYIEENFKVLRIAHRDIAYEK